VNTLVLPLNVSTQQLLRHKVKGIVISGGPGSLSTDDVTEVGFDREILKQGIPVLGICYGMQLINACFDGGKVEKTISREDGQYEIKIDPSCVLFKGMTPKQTVLLTHGDSCTAIAADLTPIAWSESNVSGVMSPGKHIYGVQFHPEVDLTPNGKTIFKNFINICGIKPSFTLQSRLKDAVTAVREQVGNKTVLCLVSGGVDSTVCAALLHKAIGKERVIPIHIDNGFMRLHESKLVEKSLRDIGIDLQVYNESLTFSVATTRIPVNIGQQVIYRPSGQLNRTINPEEKRHIIGDCFIKVYNSIVTSRRLDHDAILLAQGTLRPDLIESGSSYASATADAIKTHHNDTDLVRQMRSQGRVIEPLKDFHKDEVRVIGAELKLSSGILQRHPFPGPGLAIRILCAETPYAQNDFCETQTILKHIVSYHTSKTKPYHLFNRITECLSPSELQLLDTMTQSSRLASTLLPIQSVGVQGDCRTYSYCAAFSSNETPNWSNLFFLAKIIPRCCHNINRVTYVFGSEVKYPISDVTTTYLEKPVVDLLRVVDDQVTSVLRAESCMSKISQMPVVLIPVHFDRDPLKRLPSTRRSVVLRTFLTNDFMTGVPAQPNKQIRESVFTTMAGNICKLPGISRVLYDLTSKPPATTEWE
jgi:GMP synthase (glutamine-hydrolysing)